MILPKFLRDILTDDTGINFTPDKVGMISGIVGYHGMTVAAYVVHHQPFDPVAYGAGFGAILAAGGGSMWLASRQKPTGSSQ